MPCLKGTRLVRHDKTVTVFEPLIFNDEMVHVIDGLYY